MRVFLAFLVLAGCSVASALDAVSAPLTTMNSGGSRSTSAAYTNDDTLGEIIDAPGHGTITVRQGFAGQLYDVTGLQLTASPTTVEESKTRQIKADQVLDDATLLPVPSETTWSVVSGPLVGIDSTGLVTAGKVLQDTAATVQGSYLGKSAELNLTVQDNAADVVAFSSDRYDVFEETGTVSLTITRTGSSAGSITVSFSTVSAGSTATDGADYTGITTQTIIFADGETSKSVPVTILPGNAVNEPNEFFTVQLSNPGPGVTLGAVASAKVWIADPGDVTKPTVTISTPAANAKVNEGTAVSLSGTATDNKGVRKVQFSFNGTAFTDAPLTLNPAGTSATYTAALTPLRPGPNTVAVKSIDTRGNESSILTRSFSYIVKRPLVVNKTGTGTLTSPFPGTDSTKQAGFVYTLKATPGTGQVFNGWTANSTVGTGLTLAAMELPSITFTHQENLVLTANFITNPFTAAIIGTFNGLAQPSASVPGSGTVASNETVGGFTATVMKNGTFTSTLKIDGLSLSVPGTFDNNGVARFGTARAKTVTLARPNKPGLEVSLALDMTGTTGKLTGTVVQRLRTGIVAQSDIDADRAFYSSASKAPEALAGTASRAWTMVFRHHATQSGLTAAEYPQGDGYATGTVKADGSVSFTGKLADHTVISASSALSKVNAWPLYAALYANKGSFSSQVALTATTATDGELQGALVQWFRPYQNLQWYPWGWPEGIDTDVIGASYQSPAEPLWLGLKNPDTVNGNVDVTFRDGLINGTVDKAANFFAASVAKVPATDTAWTLTFKPGTGALIGTFTQTNNTKPTWQGVLIQRGAHMGGWGYFMTVSPKVIDGTGKSGRVEMISK